MRRLCSCWTEAIERYRQCQNGPHDCEGILDVGNLLGDSIEAQVHGPLLVAHDVEASSLIHACGAPMFTGRQSGCLAHFSGTTASASARTNCEGTLSVPV